MGEHTAISWCDHTFNAWEGCEKVSPGCKNCYAATLNGWLHGGENWEPGGPRRFFGAAHWKKPIAWNAKAKRAGERRRVFCSSLADVFEIRGNHIQDADLDTERERLWRLIAKTPDLDWLLLTKRPENLAALLPWINLAMRPREPLCRDCADLGPLCPSNGRPCDPHEPWPNVWIGTTAENDEYAKRRIPILRSTPAAVRFVSYEPALGAIDWTPHLAGAGRPDWVIFGDESGRGRRDAELDWARSTRDACAAAGVAFHFKQWCGVDAPGIAGARDKSRKIHLPVLDSEQHDAFPDTDRNEPSVDGGGA